MVWPLPGLDHRWCFWLMPFLPLPSPLHAFSHQHPNDLPAPWCLPSSPPNSLVLHPLYKVATSSTGIVSEGFSSQALLQHARQKPYTSSQPSQPSTTESSPFFQAGPSCAHVPKEGDEDAVLPPQLVCRAVKRLMMEFTM